jgi:hypothetical protein
MVTFTSYEDRGMILQVLQSDISIGILYGKQLKQILLMFKSHLSSVQKPSFHLILVQNGIPRSWNILIPIFWG